jgi:hypothetical protein
MECRGGEKKTQQIRTTNHATLFGAGRNVTENEVAKCNEEGRGKKYMEKKTLKNSHYYDMKIKILILI